MESLLAWLETLTFWHWMVLGAALIAIELLAPGFWFLWLGLGALTTGLVTLALPDLSWQLQSVVFCVLSIASVILGRAFMRRHGEAEDHPTLNRRVQQYVGRTYVLEDATLHGRGRVRIGDSIWHVELEGTDDSLAAGSSVVVTGADGSTLKVRPAP